MKTYRYMVKAEAKPNKSLDVRAKQRLSFNGAWLLLACVYSVSPHVNSIVRRSPVVYVNNLEPK